MEFAPCEGAAIAQVAFERNEAVFVFSEAELPEDVEVGFDGFLALLAISGAALALALLPAAVGVAILSGTTVPLEFGAAAGLAVLVGIKLAAVVSGIVAAAKAPRQGRPSGFD